MANPQQLSLFDNDPEPTEANAQSPFAGESKGGPPSSSTTEVSGLPFGVALLALGSIKGLGQKGLQSLVCRFGDNLGLVLNQSETELTDTFKGCEISGGDKFAALIAQDPKGLIGRAEDELQRLGARNIRVVTPSQLPERLRSIHGDAPRWLFVEGDVSVLANRPVIAVVGTREPTDNGMDAARIIATILSPYPVLMVSGLAEGIDWQAHNISLQRGVKNLAFLGHGINLVFPETTAEVRQEIVRKGGAVVSEYMPGQHFQKRQFVERNRLQAALADIVIPVEAKATSGTAHTIRFARKYARTLIGMNWPGANGIVDDLRANNDRLIDIFTSAGQRELDTLVQGILTREHVDSYPFKNLERLVLRELCNRTYSQVDVARLIETITKEARLKKPQEPPSDGATT